MADSPDIIAPFERHIEATDATRNLIAWCKQLRDLGKIAEAQTLLADQEGGSETPAVGRWGV